MAPRLNASTERVRDDSFPMRAWGLPEPGELDRVVIVSPHLDDAVLSCARFMAVHPGVHRRHGVRGQPAAYPDPMRLWDVQSGFGPRRRRDGGAPRRGRAALACSTRRRVHLDYIEHTYNPGDRPVAPEVIAAGLVADACARSTRRSCSRRSASPTPTTT